MASTTANNDDDGGDVQEQHQQLNVLAGTAYIDVDDDDDDDDDEAPDLIVLSAAEEGAEGQEDVGAQQASTATSAAAADAFSNTNSPSQPEPQPHGDLSPCPVTILSGFLGSGKSTLINYILKSPNHGKRIAVIENEFGDGLDVESMIARDGVEDSKDRNDQTGNTLQDLIELPNGCICCTVKDSLVTTLETLLLKRSDLDYILIEASGMANPGPIASVFWLDDELESRLKLDGIVSLVDGANILQQLDETEEAAQQVAYADRILLNKIDLLPDGAQQRKEEARNKTKKLSSPPRQEVEDVIRSINPTAPILATSYSQVPNLDWILDANCFGGSDRIEELEATFNEMDATDKGQKNDCNGIDCHGHSHHHNHTHDHDHDNSRVCCDGHDNCTHDHEHDHDHTHEEHTNTNSTHKHTTTISTIALKEAGSVNLTKFNAWLADILWPNQDEKDEVLTAMLYNNHNKVDNDNAKETKNDQQVQSSGNDGNKNQQQIFRIKGIVSAFYNEDDNLDLDGDDGENHHNSRNKNEKYHDVSTGLDHRRFIVQACHDLW
eukprot:CAMPEP_0113483470 /NCGR_PEP_ID=MMETSP0014_2-20120614/23449_1 /TAXON_ID=2857 /ORGANISM="Nitzschia sp." /LENGTH=550 /DNA_ID=CAMNT_0000377015 /DNA_START=11 /DNA_END=1660 /DNA_ORIENTATION=- /assembly_acc=CAM_ASM_000159